MSGQDHPQDRPQDGKDSRTLPPQPNQILTGEPGGFTPYYLSEEQARAYPGPSTPYLSSSLTHPPQDFPQPRSLFPGSDPIMDARKEGGDKPGELTFNEVQALKDVKDLSATERQARDAKEFSSSPPAGLSLGQKQRWMELLKKLLGDADEQDEFNVRARHELRKLQKLADLAEGKGK